MLARVPEAMNEEESRIHDQLPTLQEIHSKPLSEIVSYEDKARAKQRRRYLWYIVAALVLIIVTSVTVGVIGFSSKSPDKSFSESDINDRTERGLNFLGTVSSSVDLQELGSSQQRAFEWIISFDDLRLEIPKSLEDDNAAHFVSRYVLAVLYFSLDGPKWTNNYNFLTGENECFWNFSYGPNQNYGITCNEQLELKSISLPKSDLSGPLPTELGLLTDLELLAFGGNQINGKLPSEIRNLTMLKILNFYDNQLTGTIPAWLGNLSKLTWLSLSINDLTGTIPEELGSLSRLELFGVERCLKINGTIPNSLQNLVNLERFYLSYNKLRGPIPSWIGNFANLKVLSLSNNQFSSSLPETLSELANLTSLFLDDNDLTGDLSTIESLSNLELLLIEDNQFKQSLGSNFLSSLTKLRVLDASNNYLNGSLPSNLFMMTGLAVLDLHGNEIGGDLPEFPENNVLEFFALYENNISGNIPASISNLNNLTHLDLSTNKLYGTIPANIGDLTSLTYLFLAANSFDEGPIPNYLQNLSNLRELSLKRTSRNGNIPDWIGSFSKLILLDLDDNKLEETIPVTIGNLTNLHFLLLNRNVLTGTVPTALHELPNLLILLIDRNDITGLGKTDPGSGYGSEFCDTIPYLGNEGSVFISDCGGSVPKLECPCCTECCETGVMCNDDSDFLANHDLIWENGYDRVRYVFSNDTTYIKT